VAEQSHRADFVEREFMDFAKLNSWLDAQKESSIVS
jgi:hypothetical protein